MATCLGWGEEGNQRGRGKGEPGRQVTGEAGAEPRRGRGVAAGTRPGGLPATMASPEAEVTSGSHSFPL